MTDADALALNVYEEAGVEPDNGKAAVARVVLNRMRAKFESDGTVIGTVFAKDQFSWAWFGFTKLVSGTIGVQHVGEAYSRLSWTMTEAQAYAATLLAKANPAALAHCGDIAAQVRSLTYYDPLFSQLGNDAVFYLNPAILTKQPNWAIPSKFLVRIGHHNFYRA